VKGLECRDYARTWLWPIVAPRRALSGKILSSNIRRSRILLRSSGAMSGGDIFEDPHRRRVTGVFQNATAEYLGPCPTVGRVQNPEPQRCASGRARSWSAPEPQGECLEGPGLALRDWGTVLAGLVTHGAHGTVILVLLLQQGQERIRRTAGHSGRPGGRLESRASTQPVPNASFQLARTLRKSDG